MLKGKKLLKFPQKSHHSFPNGLGSLVAGFDAHGDGGEDENGVVYKELESGEELETFQPFGLGSHGDVDDHQNEGTSYVKSDAGFSEIRAPPIHKVDVEAIDADDKRSDLDYELSQKEINLEKLQRIASSGIPDGGGLRATIWKLLLGYLPPSRDMWEKELRENRLKYARLKEEFLVSPSEFSRRKDEAAEGIDQQANAHAAEPLERQEISNEDHPLSLGKASVWHKYFEFAEISEQIDRDLERTHPTIKFFSGDSAISRKSKESMKNILLLFAKLNPEIRYVQGMNEVLAPLYYVLSTDHEEKNSANVEADSFSCFVRLISDSVDHFCEQMDNSSVGIRSTLLRLSELLKASDEELWRHLELTNKVNPQFYAFRWITLLLTQEFNFRTILRIWDSLLSNPHGIQDMLLRVCCAMLLCVKTRLLSGDFVDNLKLLQHYPEINIDCILQVAQDITPDTSSFHVSL
nr:TBC1 domain family member 13-like isoform X1 [Coffea arabica]